MRKYLKIAVLVFPLSCTEIERDNPYDEHYVGNASKEGSSSSVESLSVPSSGSLGGGYSGSYGSLTYEGKTYKTVVIGTQTWMAENLNYAVSGSKCYNNLEANCTIYGRLYNLETAKTVCPSGWHLPTYYEWREMTDDNLGGANTWGKKLKATSGWNNNGNGTDEYGFSALPGGQGSSGGNFIYIGALGFWWTASEYGYAESVGIYYNSENASWHDTNESNLLSVRCVGDDPDGTGAVPSTNVNGDQTYKVDGEQIYSYSGSANIYVDKYNSPAGRIVDGKLSLDLPSIDNFNADEGFDELELSANDCVLMLIGSNNGLAHQSTPRAWGFFLYASISGEFNAPDGTKLNLKKGWNIVYVFFADDFADDFADMIVSVAQPSGLTWEWVLDCDA